MVSSSDQDFLYWVLSTSGKSSVKMKCFLETLPAVSCESRSYFSFEALGDEQVCQDTKIVRKLHSDAFFRRENVGNGTCNE